MIQEGVYPPGTQLPSEPELASRMGVSRMTLRRALSLLIDDGLVKNIRGKGNFIRAQENLSNSGKHGLETACLIPTGTAWKPWAILSIFAARISRTAWRWSFAWSPPPSPSPRA